MSEEAISHGFRADVRISGFALSWEHGLKSKVTPSSSEARVPFAIYQILVVLILP